MKKEIAGTEFVDAEPITAGCRMIKSATELALMQKASDITIEAFRAAFQTFSEGMTQDELRANIAARASRARRARQRVGQLRRLTPRFRTAASSRRN